MEPFSKSIRRFLPWEECVRLSRILSSNSLIERQEFSPKVASRRVAELAKTEQRYGFVYIGEKQWIESRHRDGRNMPYETWAEAQILAIFSEPIRSVDMVSDPRGLLQYYSNDMVDLVLFDELQNESVAFTYVSVMMPDNAARDNPILHSQIFEILHNFLYYVHTASIALSRMGERTMAWSLDEVEVCAGSREWIMRMISEYGGTIEFKFESAMTWAWSEFVGQVTNGE